MKMTNDQIIRELEIVKDSFISESGASPVCIDEAIRVIREDIRPHGKWIFVDNEIGWDKCSNCEWTDMNCHSWNYCPNCGAMMDGGEEE